MERGRTVSQFKWRQQPFRVKPLIVFGNSSSHFATLIMLFTDFGMANYIYNHFWIMNRLRAIFRHIIMNLIVKHHNCVVQQSGKTLNSSRIEMDLGQIFLGWRFEEWIHSQQNHLRPELWAFFLSQSKASFSICLPTEKKWWINSLWLNLLFKWCKHTTSTASDDDNSFSPYSQISIAVDLFYCPSISVGTKTNS